MTESNQLIAEYVESGSESAFRELVSRYINLVHSAALRLTDGDTLLSQDVSQTVFVDLAVAARTFSPSVMLGGWLHQHTCFVAAKTMRGERRRQLRERQAMEMTDLADHPEALSAQLAPILDSAITELPEPDRIAILLRFFEQCDFREVGEKIGCGEDAARMRVNRALEKLESLFKKRGITSTSAALSVSLAAGVIQAAPSGLATTISTAALTSLAAPAPAAIATTKLIAMTTLQKTVVAASLAVVATVGVFEARQNFQLHEEIRGLRNDQRPLADEVKALERERSDATNQIARLASELARSKRDAGELLRARAELTLLRAGERTDTQKAPTTSPDSTETALKAWLERVKILKDGFEQWPGRKTPELQLLSDQDWLDATAQGSLATEGERRETMSLLRLKAKQRFAELTKNALLRYADVNHQQLPSTPADLLPYFENPIDPEIIAGYKIAPPGSVHPPQPGPAESQNAKVWAMLEQGEHADEEYDHSIVIYNGGGGWWSYGPTKITRSAR